MWRGVQFDLRHGLARDSDGYSAHLEGYYYPLASTPFHIKAICNIVTQFDALFSISGMGNPKIVYKNIWRNVADHCVCNLSGSTITEDSTVVPLLCVSDSFGNGQKVRPVVGARAKPNFAAGEIVGIDAVDATA
jgi:hypothetical protein